MQRLFSTISFIVVIFFLLLSTTSTPCSANQANQHHQPQDGQRGPSTASTEDVKCQVCDIASSYYARAALSANLYCQGFTNTSKTMGYVVRAVAPFSITGISPDFCSAEAKSNLADMKKELEEAASGAGSEGESSEGGESSGGSGGEKEMKTEMKTDSNPSFALDDSVLAEMTTKSWICKEFLPSFPAIEVFAGDDANTMSPEDLEKFPNKPAPVDKQFVDVLKRACELTITGPKASLVLVDAVTKLLTEFPVADGPRSIDGARNHIWKKLLLPVQERICSKACDAGMIRHANYKPYVAFTVYGKPVLQ